MATPAPHGVLVVDKPRGPTSHDVVARLRKVLGTREIGHAGTLDPMATGVLVVAIGEGTKLVPWLTDQTKVYEATIALGVETDSLDADGQITRELPPARELFAALDAMREGAIDPAIRAALDAELARTEQVPPIYSAIRQDGVRAYKRARRGEHIEMAARAVRVARFDDIIGASNPPSLRLTLEVSKGYYVRALARDLAARIGTVGHLTSLRRTRSGLFGVEDAVSDTATAETLRAAVLPLFDAATRALPIARLTAAGAIHASHGRAVPPGDITAPAPGPCAWLDPGGRLVAIGTLDEAGFGAVRRGFRAHAAS